MLLLVAHQGIVIVPGKVLVIFKICMALCIT